ncbi:Alkaline protease-like protein [Elsinoe fawcettii]|nr:Alkaline protease-like protein [Elsinoe fawcettii]
MPFLGHFAALATSLFTITGAIPVQGGVSIRDDSLDTTDRYIIKLKPDVSLASHVATLQSIQKSNLAEHNNNTQFAGVIHKFDLDCLRGYSGHFDSVTINDIKGRSDVESVEPEKVFYTRGKVTQADAPKSLASLGNRDPAATSYSYDDSAGVDTWAYVVDTGINVDHVDFGGRASNGIVTATGISSGFTDVQGHGTFVAGLLGSTTFGAGKRTNLISVKVFQDQGGAYGSDVIAGVNWAIQDIIDKGRASKAVINMSLGGGYDQLTNDVITTAYNNNITVVVAAGNDNEPADGSPCSAPDAICVGATDGRARASYSNYGPNLDIFAEGTNVESTSKDSNTSTTVASGTSASSPVVVGLVVYLKALPENPDGLTAKQTYDLIQDLATQDVIDNVGNGSPDRLAWSGGSAIE